MAEQIDCSAKQEWRKMDQKIEKFCGILNELVNEILDIGSSFNIAILTASDELDENYEDGCYYTQVIIHEDFTATVNQYKKGDEELPPDEEFPDFDKDLIPESKCWNLPKREVLAHLAAIISPWFEDYLSKMKNGIDTLVKINVTCPTAIESLALLNLIYDRGKSVSTEFKQHKDPKSFVGDFEGYLSAYCDIDKIGARFEELQVRMGFEPVKPVVDEGQPENTAESSLTKSELSAYLSYEYATSKEPKLADATDKEVYDWLKKNGVDDYTLPRFYAWCRYVRTGRKHHGTQKNTPRAGRSGHSIAQSGQLQSLSEISSQYTNEAD